jgi:hypothetical protein
MAIPFNFAQTQIVIAGTLFALGLICMLLGIIVLMTRGYSSEVQALAAHTAKIGQKGLGDEITGVVQSASELVAAINQLVKTASGVGVFLTCTGLLMIIGAYFVLTQMDWSALV